jgi:hypothetical protein
MMSFLLLVESSQETVLLPPEIRAWVACERRREGGSTLVRKKIYFRVTGVRWTIPAKTPCPVLCTLNYYRLPCKPPPPLRFSNSTASFSWLWLGLILFIYLLLVSGHLILFFPEWPFPAVIRKTILFIYLFIIRFQRLEWLSLVPRWLFGNEIQSFFFLNFI